MIKALVLIYGVACYILFLGTFVYTIGFVGDLVVTKTINSGKPGPIFGAIAVNVILVGLFAVQHSVMARQSFKTWWTRIIPEPIERSTYVLLSSLLLILLIWQWRPMPGVIWEVTNPTGTAVLWAAFACGWLVILLSTFIIDHFDLFGLRQVYCYARGKPVPDLPFQVVWFYKYVRHPINLGWLIAFWGIPRMTEGHLLFAVSTSIYIFVSMLFEERGLVAAFGDNYRDYQRKVPMVCPSPFRNYGNQPGHDDGKV